MTERAYCRGRIFISWNKKTVMSRST